MKVGVAGLQNLDVLGLRWACRSVWQGEILSYETVRELLNHESELDIIVVPAPEVAINRELFTHMDKRLILFDERASVQTTDDRVLSRSMSESEIADRFLRAERSVHRDVGEGQRETLSSREMEVIHEVATGKTNKEIAETLCISVNTVITHRKNIYAKLGIRSASGLSLYAMMHGLIDGVGR